MSNLFTCRTAKFSDDRRYRFMLEIVWDERKPLAAFIGLNPSTADEVDDDPTIRRCIGFAQSWGCGGIRMLNLFAFRATDPKAMKAEAWPIGGFENDLRVLIQGCDGHRVACWGTHGAHLGQGAWVKTHLSGLQCLGLTKDGFPKHPLYLKATTPLEPFSDGRRM